MSTILDALKRLEDERHKERMRQAPAGMHGEAPAHFRFSFRITVLLLAALTAIGGAAAFLWISKGASGVALKHDRSNPEPAVVRSSPAVPGASAPVSQGPEQLAQGIAAKTATDLSPASRQPVKREKIAVPATAPNRAVAPVYSKAFQAGNRAQQPLQEHPKINVRHQEAAESQGPPIVPDTANSGENPATTPPVRAADENVLPPHRTGLRTSATRAGKPLGKSAGLQAAPNQDPYVGLEALPRGTLMLQAISWSTLPKARITVINGRILHEGQTIEDYTVTQIRSEDVILNKAGQHWKLNYSNQ